MGPQGLPGTIVINHPHQECLDSSWLDGKCGSWQGCPSQLISPKHFVDETVHKKVWFPPLPAVRQGQPGERAVLMMA